MDIENVTKISPRIAAHNAHRLGRLLSFSRAPVADHPMRNAFGHPPMEDRPREPAPEFTVDQRAGCVFWRMADGQELRLIHAPQFRALADVFAENGWIRHFNALLEAELALSAPPLEAA